MRGLALEGGGARGAYHMGVVKALMENGYVFDGFVGTSIGAVNAGALAQGNLDAALELWANISLKNLLGDNEQQILEYINSKGVKANAEFISLIKNAFSKMKAGINTGSMKTFLQNHIDEALVRGSGKDFGLVTISLDDFKPHELMLEDIPQGQLLNYIMASASLPIFQREVIGEKRFLDGAFYNNCPYHLLLDRGYDEVIVVRTNARGIFRKVTDPSKVKVITPRDDLGQTMLFSPENCAANIRLGYYDGMRYARGLRGTAYYIALTDTAQADLPLMSLPREVILEAGKALGIAQMPAKRMLFEKIIPRLSKYLKLDKNSDYADFAIALLEHMASRREVERFQVYDYASLCALVKSSPTVKEESGFLQSVPLKLKVGNEKAAIEILGNGLYA